MGTLRDVLSAHAFTSIARQHLFAGRLGDDEFSFDLKTGTGRLGANDTCRVQLLGTTDATNLRWGWASEGVPAAVQGADETLQRFGETTGLTAFVNGEVAVSGTGPHALALIACGVLGADAYFNGPFEDGQIFLALYDTGAADLKTLTAQQATGALNTVIMTYEIDHRVTCEAFFKRAAQTFEVDDDGLRAQMADGHWVVLTFDPQHRITSMAVALNED